MAIVESLCTSCRADNLNWEISEEKFKPQHWKGSENFLILRKYFYVLLKSSIFTLLDSSLHFNAINHLIYCGKNSPRVCQKFPKMTASTWCQNQTPLITLSSGKWNYMCGGKAKKAELNWISKRIKWSPCLGYCWGRTCCLSVCMLISKLISSSF